MFKRLITYIVIISFILSYYQPVYAQPAPPQAGDFSVNQLPVPGTMVGESAPFAPLALKGLVVNLQKPLEFQFIVDTGNSFPQDMSSPNVLVGDLPQEQFKQQANQLVKYFLAGLTIPEGDLWVNLSPYEKNRMVPEVLGQTDLGRDLLAQDYILKQLTASLIYPEKDLGKEFWSRVYAKAQQQFGTTNVPVNTFNKVWILPDQAQVFEHGAAAYVTKATLKVMLDEDYTALQKHNIQKSVSSPNAFVGDPNTTHTLSSQIIREIVLPEITKEVNTGKNFAPLRQIYQALILAKWYKQTIQNGLLDAVYTNKNKVAGVNLNDPTIKEQIYERYLKAYKKGAFNYIKEDSVPDGPIVTRKYFSGGTFLGNIPVTQDFNPADVKSSDGAMAALNISLDSNAAMQAEKVMITAADIPYVTDEVNGYLKDRDVEWSVALSSSGHKITVIGQNNAPFMSFNIYGVVAFENIINKLNEYIVKKKAVSRKPNTEANAAMMVGDQLSDDVVGGWTRVHPDTLPMTRSVVLAVKDISGWYGQYKWEGELQQYQEGYLLSFHTNAVNLPQERANFYFGSASQPQVALALLHTLQTKFNDQPLDETHKNIFNDGPPMIAQFAKDVREAIQATLPASASEGSDRVYSTQEQGELVNLKVLSGLINDINRFLSNPKRYGYEEDSNSVTLDLPSALAATIGEERTKELIRRFVNDGLHRHASGEGFYFKSPIKHKDTKEPLEMAIGRADSLKRRLEQEIKEIGARLDLNPEQLTGLLTVTEEEQPAPEPAPAAVEQISSKIKAADVQRAVELLTTRGFFSTMVEEYSLESFLGKIRGQSVELKQFINQVFPGDENTIGRRTENETLVHQQTEYNEVEIFYQRFDTKRWVSLVLNKDGVVVLLSALVAKNDWGFAKELRTLIRDTRPTSKAAIFSSKVLSIAVPASASILNTIQDVFVKYKKEGNRQLALGKTLSSLNINRFRIDPIITDKQRIIQRLRGQKISTQGSRYNRQQGVPEDVTKDLVLAGLTNDLSKLYYCEIPVSLPNNSSEKYVVLQTVSAVSVFKIDAAMMSRRQLVGTLLGAMGTKMLWAQETPSVIKSNAFKAYLEAIKNNITYTGKTDPTIYSEQSSHPVRKILEAIQQFHTFFMSEAISKSPHMNNVAKLQNDLRQSLETIIGKEEILKLAGELSEKRNVESLGFGEFMLQIVGRYLAKFNIVMLDELLPEGGKDSPYLEPNFFLYEIKSVEKLNLKSEDLWGEALSVDSIMLGKDIQIKGRYVNPVGPNLHNDGRSAYGNMFLFYDSNQLYFENVVGSPQDRIKIKELLSQLTEEQMILAARKNNNESIALEYSITQLRVSLTLDQVQKEGIEQMIYHEGKHVLDKLKISSGIALEVDGYLTGMRKNFTGWVLGLDQAFNATLPNALAGMNDTNIATRYIMKKLVEYIQAHRADFPMIKGEPFDAYTIKAQLYKIKDLELRRKVVDAIYYQHQKKEEYGHEEEILKGPAQTVWDDQKNHSSSNIVIEGTIAAAVATAVGIGILLKWRSQRMKDNQQKPVIQANLSRGERRRQQRQAQKEAKKKKPDSDRAMKVTLNKTSSFKDIYKALMTLNVGPSRRERKENSRLLALAIRQVFIEKGDSVTWEDIKNIIQASNRNVTIEQLQGLFNLTNKGFNRRKIVGIVLAGAGLVTVGGVVAWEHFHPAEELKFDFEFNSHSGEEAAQKVVAGLKRASGHKTILFVEDFKQLKELYPVIEKIKNNVIEVPISGRKLGDNHRLLSINRAIDLDTLLSTDEKVAKHEIEAVLDADLEKFKKADAETLMNDPYLKHRAEVYVSFLNQDRDAIPTDSINFGEDSWGKILNEAVHHQYNPQIVREGLSADAMLKYEACCRFFNEAINTLFEGKNTPNMPKLLNKINRYLEAFHLSRQLRDQTVASQLRSLAQDINNKGATIVVSRGENHYITLSQEIKTFEGMKIPVYLGFESYSHEKPQELSFEDHIIFSHIKDGEYHLEITEDEDQLKRVIFENMLTSTIGEEEIDLIKSKEGKARLLSHKKLRTILSRLSGAKLDGFIQVIHDNPFGQNIKPIVLSAYVLDQLKKFGVTTQAELEEIFEKVTYTDSPTSTLVKIRVEFSNGQIKDYSFPKPPNRAMITIATRGGIDLNQINVNRIGKRISVQFDQAQLNEIEQSDFKGFRPVITGFRYIQSPFPLLGINNPAKESKATQASTV